jgi:hypothetical protein
VILLIDRLLPDRFADIPDHRRMGRADLTMMGYGGQERSERSSPTSDSSALRIPSLEEKRRYTVAGVCTRSWRRAACLI